MQIVKSCDKVLSLSVQEPLMKILAGLEYILRRAQVSELVNKHRDFKHSKMCCFCI